MWSGHLLDRRSAFSDNHCLDLALTRVLSVQTIFSGQHLFQQGLASSSPLRIKLGEPKGYSVEASPTLLKVVVVFRVWFMNLKLKLKLSFFSKKPHFFPKIFHSHLIFFPVRYYKTKQTGRSTINLHWMCGVKQNYKQLGLYIMSSSTWQRPKRI